MFKQSILGVLFAVGLSVLCSAAVVLLDKHFQKSQTPLKPNSQFSTMGVSSFYLEPRQEMSYRDLDHKAELQPPSLSETKVAENSALAAESLSASELQAAVPRI